MRTNYLPASRNQTDYNHCLKLENEFPEIPSGLVQIFCRYERKLLNDGSDGRDFFYNMYDVRVIFGLDEPDDEQTARGVEPDPMAIADLAKHNKPTTITWVNTAQEVTA